MHAQPNLFLQLDEFGWKPFKLKIRLQLVTQYSLQAFYSELRLHYYTDTVASRAF